MIFRTLSSFYKVQKWPVMYCKDRTLNKKELKSLFYCQKQMRSYYSKKSFKNLTQSRLKEKSYILKLQLPAISSPFRAFADKKEIQKNIDDFREGNYKQIPDPGTVPHFRAKKTQSSSLEEKKGLAGKEIPEFGTYTMRHPIWTDEQLMQVEVTHKDPEGITDRLAFTVVKIMRATFDFFSGFNRGKRTEQKWLTRICFLETVAGVPGMVAAMLRHMRSLRRMQRDQGWIHTLLGEAENERMHLLTAMQIKKPSMLFRLSVIGTQGVFVPLFGISYIISPKFCHRFVGYLEEEAVITYTKCVNDIDHGFIKHWQTVKAPVEAVNYWQMHPDATMRDMILAIRADEAHHRVVNHCLASLKKDEFNPYKPGE